MTTPDFPLLAAIRLGSGLSPHTPLPENPEAVFEDLRLTAAIPPVITTADAIALDVEYRNNTRLRRQPDHDPEVVRLVRDKLTRVGYDGFLRRLALAAEAPVGFGERLVQFWSNHFTIRGQRPPDDALALSHVEAAIRPNIAGRFADLLKPAIAHPSMIKFLDQTNSVGPASVVAQRDKDRRAGLNENLARELIELHTLGVGGNYSQTDIRELAKLLTGIVYQPSRGLFYDPRRAEPGAETVLGQSYGGRKASILDVENMLDDLAVHPDTARHIAFKLARHFVADEPDPDLVSAMATRFEETAGDLTAVYTVLINHPALADNFRRKTRQPLDMIIATLRGLGWREADIMRFSIKEVRNLLLTPMALMGHRWGDPLGPDGLPEDAEAWINPQLLAARIDWIMRLLPRLGGPMPDARDAVKTLLATTASEKLLWAVPRAETNAEGLGILLASADFNRR